MFEGIMIVVVIAAVALVAGLAFGRVVAAPALRRLADRLDAASDAPEESGDRQA